MLARLAHEPGLLKELSLDWMRVKSSAENAAEIEFRYRGLVARVRERERVRLLAGAANLQYRSEGAVERQGKDLLLLRPGSWGRFPLSRPDVPGAAGNEPFRLLVTLRLFSLGGERGVRLGGNIGLAGGENSPIQVVNTTESDTTTEQVFEFKMIGPTGELELSTKDLFLRIESILVKEAGLAHGGSR